ncbi:hypothetical protein [Sphaerotilus microaerophilus]|uniref:Uncharacterized protein n=1 Tax=Sphaerotilus microaerophilus TaxID=2914710 RepID=A0ABN6PSU2_9BURK|nr:hypothetical protein [Sphaerotilus sp. FB-5]BDI06300.1 hypothetical protein CATMQ487_32700 [Sphaerotilus sp. FB-5]
MTEAKLHLETTDLERQVIEAGDVGLEILSDSVQFGAAGQVPVGCCATLLKALRYEAAFALLCLVYRDGALSHLPQAGLECSPYLDCVSWSDEEVR